MSRNYDRWERLVAAVLRREKDRQLAYCESFSTSSSLDPSSRFSLDSHLQHAYCESFSNSSSLDPNSRFSLDSHLQHEASRSFGPKNILFSSKLMAIEYDEIIKATKNFGDERVLLEEGFFSPVFKGWLHEHYLYAVKPGSGIAVAIKRLSSNNEHCQGHKEWLDEINYFRQRRRHPNLITLIGYSFDDGDQDCFLVYEFMPKGSLANQLFRRGCELLPWETRIKVALDVARALAFLHAFTTPVMHVKSTEIFLDSDFNAKLRDFNPKLSEYCLCPKVSELHPAVFEPRQDGYVDPIYLRTGLYFTKCDVYSFGVVLVELISSLRAYDVARPSEERLLMNWVKPYLTRKRLSLIIDGRLKGQYLPTQAYKVAQIALKCLHSDQKLRPRMAEVVAALETLQ